MLAWWLWAWVNGAYDIQLSSRASSLVPAMLRAMLFQSLTFVGLAFFARGFTGRIVWAWVLTIPAAGIIAALVYYLRNGSVFGLHHDRIGGDMHLLSDGAELQCYVDRHVVSDLQ